ncbi:MAG: nickel pincer cofactor biosynthesis protein LarC [Candidatus Magnetoovum sp. WYHC-5]|nr:nickel pincer cofactor biosynthesis protein LarC [Candidatus Magnetoovum sp. WYHC-5]
MAKIAYIECTSGVSGDMLVGALIDAGVPLGYLVDSLAFLPNSSYELNVHSVTRGHLRAAKFNVSVNQAYAQVRTWKDISQLIEGSSLDLTIKTQALRMFRSIFEAEAKVHGLCTEEIHLHELGAIDCIVDIVGALLCLHYLKIEQVSASPINVGGGTIHTAHGILPVPAPATAELLCGLPVYSSGANMELTTPTGACILKNIVGSFSAIPNMMVEHIGYGAGFQDPEAFPNVLRIFIGKHGLDNSLEVEKVSVVETNIDDMSPQMYESLIEDLFADGALDVFLTPIIMKKSRPAVKITVIVFNKERQQVIDRLFLSTTTIGLRYYEVYRNTLDRQINLIDTAYGKVRVKVALKKGVILNMAPEYEDCKRISKELGIPIKKVIAHVMAQCHNVYCQD